MEETQMIEGILKEFAGLAKHPRKSYHEKEVSDYIVGRLRELGAQSIVQDDVYNVIADFAPTKGYESVPRTVIQGHMDMVCVAKPGRAFDPLKDEIILKRNGNILGADGTSLGADDGMAIAISLFLLEQHIDHGPLRLIFTVDEEVSMTGATHLDPKYVQDVAYIINCDSEAVDTICMASAGSVHMHFDRAISWQAPSYDSALTIRVEGLLGGHSGETINNGKCNAIKAVASILQRIHLAGIAFDVEAITGGVAANAIPADAFATIVLQKGDMAKAKEVVDTALEDFQHIYGAVEQNLSISATEVALPEKTFSAADSRAVVQLLNLLHFGVFAMNQRFPKLPDLSANIGIIETTEKGLSFEYFPRSSSDARLNELKGTLPIFAEVTGFTLVMGNQSPAWTENPKSVLAPTMVGIYETELGFTPKVEAIHGGLETGYFYAMNPDLDIVSIGPSTFNIHSPEETVDLQTAAQIAKVIARTLVALKK